MYFRGKNKILQPNTNGTVDIWPLHWATNCLKNSWNTLIPMFMKILWMKHQENCNPLVWWDIVHSLRFLGKNASNRFCIHCCISITFLLHLMQTSTLLRFLSASEPSYQHSKESVVWKVRGRNAFVSAISIK